MPNPDIKDPLVPQQDNSVFDSIPERPWREKLKFKQPASMTEPVATLPATLDLDHCFKCGKGITETLGLQRVEEGVVCFDCNFPASQVEGATAESELQRILRLRKELDPDAPDAIVIDSAPGVGGEPKGKCPICGDPAEIAACCGGYACTKWEREQQVARGGGEPELLPWIEAQIEGIQRSSIVEASRGALNAFLAVKKKLLTTRVSQPADWLRDNEIKRLTDERNQLAEQGAELWERANTDQPAGEPSDAEAIVYDLLNAFSRFHSQMTRCSDEEAFIRCMQFPCQNAWRVVKRVSGAIAAAQPSPTPADEEVAREVVDGVYSHYVTAYRGEEERRMFIARISAALARRAGTPTTDARAMRGLLNAAVKWREARTRYHSDASVTVTEYGEAGDALAMAITAALEIPVSTPSDEVAQRARAAAEEICNLSAASEGCCVCFQSEEILAIITKHFTGGAFNEESKKCSKCEEPPVMERDGVVWLLRCLTCGKVRSSAWGKDDLVKRWNEAQRVSEIKQ